MVEIKRIKETSLMQMSHEMLEMTFQRKKWKGDMPRMYDNAVSKDAKVEELKRWELKKRKDWFTWELPQVFALMQSMKECNLTQAGDDGWVERLGSRMLLVISAYYIFEIAYVGTNPIFTTCYGI